MTATPDLQTPEEILASHFGYTSFRPGQREAIYAVIGGRDAVVVMPTGGGKSVCFQVPALAMPGMALVVSPLIALMKDQVDALVGNGITAAYLNSSLGAAEARQVLDDVHAGRLKLLYVSPERLLSDGLLHTLSGFPISLVAIDEAHCISSWGHDFRPEYTQLGKLKDALPTVPIIALTATADKITRQDIALHLRLKEGYFEQVSSFDRPNIHLAVVPANSRTQQIGRYILKHRGQAGIVYCLSRKTCEAVASALLMQGTKAAPYHAGLPTAERDRVQEGFLKDDIEVVCATIAFGMGIDKSNVRFVLHYNLPKNVEGYYQEIGRAGRDGLPSEAVLFYSYADVTQLSDMMLKEAVTLERQELIKAKLERMTQFADASQCRRRVLLAYFGEQRQQDCGYCDVCQNPRQRIDGTLIAQKALSATIRVGERAGRASLIEILRGNRTQEITSNGWDTIKTFGVGGDFAPYMWKDYFIQLINGGYLEVAYDQNHALRVTPLGKEVLFNGLKVMLVQPEKPVVAAQQQTSAIPSTLDPAREDILALLKRKRKTLADERGVPPYQIFSDATLVDMVTYLPKTEEDFRVVSGVGDYKSELYWQTFTSLIRQAVQEKENLGVHIPPYARIHTRKARRDMGLGAEPRAPKEDTRKITLQLYQEGKKIEEIAAERSIGEDTVLGHLCQLFLAGQDIDLSFYLKRTDFFEIKKAVEQEGGLSNPTMRPTFDRLGGKYTYGEIRVARTFMMKGALPTN